MIIYNIRTAYIKDISKSKIEIRKQLAVLELGDLTVAIENQKKDVLLMNLNYNDRLRKLYDSKKAKAVIDSLR